MGGEERFPSFPASPRGRGGGGGRQRCCEAEVEFWQWKRGWKEAAPAHCGQGLCQTCTARFTEWSGLEGTSVGHPVQPPAQAGSPRAGCTGPRPGGAGISPEKKTPQPPWAAWARAPSPSEGRISSSASAGASSAPVCARCPLSCHWAPLERVWPRPPDPPPADIWRIF